MDANSNSKPHGDDPPGLSIPGQQPLESEYTEDQIKMIYAAMMEELGVGRKDTLPLDDGGHKDNLEYLKPIKLPTVEDPNDPIAAWRNVKFDDIHPSDAGLDTIADGQLYRQRRSATSNGIQQRLGNKEIYGSTRGSGSSAGRGSQTSTPARQESNRDGRSPLGRRLSERIGLQIHSSRPLRGRFANVTRGRIRRPNVDATIQRLRGSPQKEVTANTTRSQTLAVFPNTAATLSSKGENGLLSSRWADAETKSSTPSASNLVSNAPISTTPPGDNPFSTSSVPKSPIGSSRLLGRLILKECTMVKLKLSNTAEGVRGVARLVKDSSTDVYVTLELESNNHIVLTRKIVNIASLSLKGMGVIFRPRSEEEYIIEFQLPQQARDFLSIVQATEVSDEPRTQQLMTVHESHSASTEDVTQRNMGSEGPQTFLIESSIVHQPSEDTFQLSESLSSSPPRCAALSGMPMQTLLEPESVGISGAFHPATKHRISSQACSDMSEAAGIAPLISFADGETNDDIRDEFGNIPPSVQALLNMDDKDLLAAALHFFERDKTSTFLNQLSTKVVKENGPAASDLSGAQILSSQLYRDASENLTGAFLCTSEYFVTLPDIVSIHYTIDKSRKLLEIAVAMRDSRQAHSVISETDVSNIPETKIIKDVGTVELVTVIEVKQKLSHGIDNVTHHRLSNDQSAVEVTKKLESDQKSFHSNENDLPRIAYSVRDLHDMRKHALPLKEIEVSDEVATFILPSSLASPNLPPIHDSSTCTTQDDHFFNTSREEVDWENHVVSDTVSDPKPRWSVSDWQSFSQQAKQEDPIPFGAPATLQKVIPSEDTVNGISFISIPYVESSGIAIAQTRQKRATENVLQEATFDTTLEGKRVNISVHATISTPTKPKMNQLPGRVIGHNPTNSDCDRLAKTLEALNLDNAVVTQLEPHVLKSEGETGTMNLPNEKLKQDREPSVPGFQVPLNPVVDLDLKKGVMSNDNAGSVLDPTIPPFDMPNTIMEQGVVGRDEKNLRSSTTRALGKTLTSSENFISQYLKDASGLTASRWATEPDIPKIISRPRAIHPPASTSVSQFSPTSTERHPAVPMVGGLPMMSTLSPVFRPAIPISIASQTAHNLPSPFSFGSSPINPLRSMGHELRTILIPDVNGNMVEVTGIAKPENIPLQGVQVARPMMFMAAASPLAPSPGGRAESQASILYTRPALSPVENDENVQFNLQSRLNNSSAGRCGDFQNA